MAQHTPAASLQAAQVARQAGDLWLAVGQARGALAQNAANLDARLLLGDLYQSLALYDLAATQYRAVIRADKNRAEPYIGMAAIVHARHRPQDAAQWMQRAQRDAAPSTANLILLARAYQNNDDSADAFAMLDRAAQLAPDDPDVALQRASFLIYYARLDEARPLLENFLKQHPDNGLATRLLGVLLSTPSYKHADLMGARTLLERAAELNPRDVMIYSAIAPIYRQQHLPRLAAQAYDIILQLDPFNVEARYGLAQIYAQLGKPDLSREQMALFTRLQAQQHEMKRLNLAVRNEPTNAQTHARLARYAQEAGRCEIALEQSETAVTLAPHNAAMRAGLGALTASLGWKTSPEPPQ
jgi:tetratricopeptide (TPR) repeat protein